MIFFVKWLVPLLAALPPLAQSQAEIQALLSDERLYALLGSPEIIQEIIRTSSGYLVVTQHALVCVDVLYQQASHPGPVPFELQFKEPINLERDGGRGR